MKSNLMLYDYVRTNGGEHQNCSLRVEYEFIYCGIGDLCAGIFF